MSEQQSDIAIGNITDMANDFRAWLIKQGAPNDKADNLMNHWHDFIRSEDGRKHRFRHQ